MPRILFTLGIWLSLFCPGVYLFGQQADTQALFVVFQKGQAGYIDSTGAIVVAPKFRNANEFHGDRTCAVPSGETRYGLIDLDGRLLGPPQFTACGEFSEGLLPVAFETERTQHGCMDCDPFYHWGYVDGTGKMVIKPQFHRAEQFAGGVAAVEDDQGRWGFIDSSGRTVIGFHFDYAESFSEGLAAVVIHQRFGYIDHRGVFQIPPQFPYAGNFSEGMALVRVSGPFVAPFGISLRDSGKEASDREKFAYIDRKGNSKIRFGAEHASRYSEGLAAFGVVKPDGYLYCGYMNTSGKEVIQPKYGDCEDFSEGLALVLLQGKWHFIDKNGEFILDANFAQVEFFHRGLARVSGFGYMNKSGKVVWTP